MIKRNILIVILTTLVSICNAQKTIVISIKSFGAKGNGITNDNAAFEKAGDYINKIKSNVTLTIPKGNYIIGKQNIGNKDLGYLTPNNILHLIKCNNIKIKGQLGANLIFDKNLKYGSFDPQTGMAMNTKSPFYDRSKMAQLGVAIYIDQCENVQISNLNIDGNISHQIIGGPWGDIGYQLWHYGIYLLNSSNIKLQTIYAHHFGLDGIIVNSSNSDNMNISLIDSKFEYNGRQALSWIGGNGLNVKNCKFNFTGKSTISSSPGAGVDIEAEGNNQISNGIFENCEFLNNSGPGLVANTGPSKNIKFNKCTFWGLTNYSAWVEKPNYVFNSCNFYGSFAHGYITNELEDATKFYKCNFEDKKLNSQKVYGLFLLESDGRNLMVFEDCNFTSNENKIMWYNGKGDNAHKATLKNCTINVKSQNLQNGDFFAVMRRMSLDNVSFNYYFPKEKKNYLNEDSNIKTNVKANYMNK